MTPARLLPIAALLLSSAALAEGDGISSTPIAGTRLDVSAEGEVQRAPDLAIVTAGVVTQARTAQGALADNAARATQAIAALRKAGVAERDIRTASISLQPQYRYAENQPPVLTGYQASDQLTVRFHDVARTGAILDALVAAGINQIGGPDFVVEKPDAAFDEARGIAVAKARARADLYARSLGMSVARIVAVREQSAGGQGPVDPPGIVMMARAAKAPTPVQPGEQPLTVSVAVTFELR